MDNLYLKFPTLEDKDKWIDYIKEYRMDNPKAMPLSCTEDVNYEAWLERMKEEHSGINLKSYKIPTSVYFLMNGDRIIGNLTIRHNIETEFFALYGGHIGYGIRPSERNKGYGTKLLHLALEKCDELGIENVMISCKKDNIASSKVIENNGGVLEEIVFMPVDNTKLRKYWINVKEELNKKTPIKK